MVKHLVYRHYLECWMSKILQRFPRATIVDAFAGPGTYKDSLHGSPLLIAKTYRDHIAHPRFGDLDLLCLEGREDRSERLRHELAALGAIPKLHYQVLEPAEFATTQPTISDLAHGGQPNRPVLWLLDPFNIKSLPFSVVRASLVAQRDEAIITFFVDEMHRFCTRAGFGQVLDDHFGSDVWSQSARIRSESARKEALADAYCRVLDGQGLLTGRFAVRVRNETARYYLVFATHSQYGLQCWNPVKWKLDSYGGAGASAATVNQPDLFGTSDIAVLRSALVAYAGEEKPWDELLGVSNRLGFMEKHLRDALDALAQDGLAFRVHPTDAKTNWPAGSVVRFYRNEDADAPVVEPLDA